MAVAEPPAACTVYFDGDCPLCRREIAAYRRLAGAEGCHWVDAAQADAVHLGPDLDRRQALRELNLRRADGTLLRGVDAFIAMWAQLDATRTWARWATRPPLHALLRLAYRLFLALRPLWRRP
jgi:predicted DCC family thiol-disulfide oxidoreductase YuxK